MLVYQRVRAIDGKIDDKPGDEYVNMDEWYIFRETQFDVGFRDVQSHLWGHPTRAIFLTMREETWNEGIAWNCSFRCARIQLKRGICYEL